MENDRLKACGHPRDWRSWCLECALIEDAQTRERGRLAALAATPQATQEASPQALEVHPEWFEVEMPGADFDVSFAKTMQEALELNDGDPDAASYITPLYTRAAPLARVPLTGDELAKGHHFSCDWVSFVEGARFAERQHGITATTTPGAGVEHG